MMNRTSNRILEMQFRPLTRKADELITEIQKTAFNVRYNQGIDDLVTYLRKKGFDLPIEIKGLKGSAVSQIIEKEL